MLPTALLLALMIPWCAHAAIVASSQIQQCVRDGSVEPSSSAGVPCTQKMVVTMAIQSGSVSSAISQFNTDHILMLHFISQNGGEQIETLVNSATGLDGVTRLLETQYIIALEKTIPVALYPLQYVEVRVLNLLSCRTHLHHRIDFFLSEREQQAV